MEVELDILKGERCVACKTTLRFPLVLFLHHWMPSLSTMGGSILLFVLSDKIRILNNIFVLKLHYQFHGRFFIKVKHPHDFRFSKLALTIVSMVVVLRITFYAGCCKMIMKQLIS